MPPTTLPVVASADPSIENASGRCGGPWVPSVRRGGRGRSTGRADQTPNAAAGRSSAARAHPARRRVRRAAGGLGGGAGGPLRGYSGGLAGSVGGLGQLAGGERGLLRGAEEDRADPLAHAPLGDHHPGQAGGRLEVARGAGGQVVEDE